ncbi:hypothetical protein [Chryseobacterium terrae]|uniref:Scaffolding protein n=1 Tax=Chryseobacterium terrae TaxID=3163299 RepID=A0ABW8Y478_9FLAO
MSTKKDTEATPLTEEQLSQKEAELNEREDQLNAREEGLNQKETDLAELENSLLNAETETEEGSEIVPGEEFKIGKDKYKFKDSAPRTLNLGGSKLSQEEIVKDKDLLQKIVKTSHIEKIK